MPLLDVILGYDCNLACDYCTITQPMRAKALGARAVVEALRRGVRDGYERVSFTGGEPTIRPDLLALVREAARLGYADVKVQTNGLLLGQGDNAGRMVRAGVTRFHVSIHAHDPQRYDALVRRSGSHAHMVEGLRAAVATGLPVTADVILKEDTYRALPSALRWLDGHGVKSVDLWLVSLTDQNRPNVASLPRMVDVVPFVREALAYGRDHGIAVRSLHLPRCLLGPDHGHAFDPGADDVRVVTPEATFDLRRSKLAGQRRVPACRGCAHESICPGLREDYLEVFGDDEVAAARGESASVAPVRRLALAGEARGAGGDPGDLA